jgi:hypothetical protein
VKGKFEKRINMLIPSEVFVKVYNAKGIAIDEIKVDRCNFIDIVDEARKEFPQVGDVDKPHYKHEYLAIEEWIGKVEKWCEKWVGSEGGE